MRTGPNRGRAGAQSFILAGLGLAALLWSAAVRAQEPVAPLRALQALGGNSVTVSGLSSGGFFAHQFHVAWSSVINGAAIIAGGPYACAEQVPWWLAYSPLPKVTIALAVCTRAGRDALGLWSYWLPEAPDPADSVTAIREAHRRGAIDDPANLAGDRAWLFSGGRDDVVTPPTVTALRTVYENIGIRGQGLGFRQEPDAAHGMPIEELTGESDFPELDCNEHEPPFLIDCNFDAAELLLRHLYSDIVPAPGVADRSRLVRFDQAEFFDAADASVSLGRVGYVYVPASCSGNAAPAGRCRLHVAFHGCLQHEGEIGDDFYWDGGYNRWAEANRTVVLYPQATAWVRAADPSGIASNPQGCWDWWGYSGADYAGRTGKQMRAVKAMIDRLLPD
jgi:poly(3-hydroxybutyrate) depolymerase